MSIIRNISGMVVGVYRMCQYIFSGCCVGSSRWAASMRSKTWCCEVVTRYSMTVVST